MIKLILKYLNKIKQFFVIVPVLIGVMLLAGLFFANQKSKPEFENKAERMMFDTKDKSPQYVMTLPEKAQAVTKEVNEEDTDMGMKPKTKRQNEEKQPSEEEKPKTNSDKLNELEIPFLFRLAAPETIAELANVSPSADVVQQNNKGQTLPVKSGTLKAWEVYGRKTFVMPMFNKVSIVLKNMGVNKQNANLLVTRLPSDISFSFSPYADQQEEFIQQARENGHETYLDIILPSRDFLTTDNGPQAINFGKDVNDNISLLEKQLSKNIAVGGFVMNDGVDDDEYRTYFLSIMEMLESRGLLLLDATHGINVSRYNATGLARVRADIIIDKDFSRDTIREQLEQAEQIASRDGSVVVVAEPKPVVVLELDNWIKTFSKQLSYEEMKAQNVTEFDKPLILVPLSNLVGEI